jgi:hypothetical protein
MAAPAYPRRGGRASVKEFKKYSDFRLTTGGSREDGNLRYVRWANMRRRSLRWRPEGVEKIFNLRVHKVALFAGGSPPPSSMSIGSGFQVPSPSRGSGGNEHEEGAAVHDPLMWQGARGRRRHAPLQKVILRGPTEPSLRIILQMPTMQNFNRVHTLFSHWRGGHQQRPHR